MPDITQTIAVAAPAERVYAALATADGIRGWWTRDADLDSKVGGKGEFRFNECRTITTVRIDELEPSARVAWTTIASNAPGGWAGTTITFDLRAESGQTLLALAHRGFARADEGYARVTEGWGIYLASLRRHLETGTGAPH